MARVIREAGVALLILFLAPAAAGWVGPGSTAHWRLLGACFLLVATALFGSHEAGPSRSIRIVAVVLACIGLVPAWSSTTLLSLGLGAFALLGSGSGVAVALMSAGTLAAAAPLWPELRVLLELISRRAPFDSDVVAGPTTAGVPILFLGVASAAGNAFGVRGGASRSAATLALAAVIAIIAATLVHARVLSASITFPLAAAADAYRFLPALSLACAALASIPMLAGRSEVQQRLLPASRRAVFAALLGGGSLGVILLVPLVAPSERSSNVSRVLFFGRGGLDWHRPTYGNYGAFDGGMFGLLPVFLESDGFQCDTLETDELVASDLEGTDVFVIINCDKVWSNQERAAIRERLEAGMSMLVLGDHTNVFGLQDGLNSLLQDYGVRFPFDSAYMAAGSWWPCTRRSLGPLGIWSGSQFRLGTGIGASLECDPDVEVLVGAPYAFSDRGIESNHLGAYLGNYRADARERIGDLAIVASTVHGKGRVLVYGDTGPFQNAGLAGRYGNHVLPIFRWLSADVHLLQRRPIRRALALVFLVAIGLGLATARRLFPLAAAALLAVLTLVPSSGGLGTVEASFHQHSVIVDEGLLPNTGFYDVRFNAISPLFSNLARAGLEPMVEDIRSIDLGAIDSAVVALVSPTRSPGKKLVRDLIDYQNRGGVVLLIAGREHSPGATPLLRELGVELEDRHLGRVETVAGTEVDPEAPRFRDAWPIVEREDAVISSEWFPLFRAEGDVLASFHPRGAGGTILIADSRFFSTVNFEGDWGYWPGNVLLVHDLVRQFVNAPMRPVHDRFESPEKPR